MIILYYWQKIKWARKNVPHGMEKTYDQKDYYH